MFSKLCKSCGVPFQSAARNKQKCDLCVVYKPRQRSCKHDLHEDFFRVWSSDMAYVVGFICADGYIRARGSTGSSLQLVIMSTDEDVIKKIGRLLSSDLPVRCREKGLGNKLQYRVEISMGRMIRPLMELGVCLNKSHSLGPISVPHRYFWHFARGFTDGDGSITRSRQLPRVSWVGASFGFMSWFHEEICKRVDIQVVLSKPRQRDHWQFCFSGSSAMKVLIELYRDASIYMDRKFRKFRCIIEEGSEVVGCHRAPSGSIWPGFVEWPLPGNNWPPGELTTSLPSLS